MIAILMLTMLAVAVFVESTIEVWTGRDMAQFSGFTVFLTTARMVCVSAIVVGAGMMFVGLEIRPTALEAVVLIGSACAILRGRVVAPNESLHHRITRVPPVRWFGSCVLDPATDHVIVKYRTLGQNVLICRGRSQPKEAHHG